ncbi:ABC transporter substrate-binding protein [Dactylosporangium sp. NPDC005572]|uniref:ABC transporter substrate-binding protein n=1 Tax=Dactylosporangium sp. NPDC005572 TaxID=3156889 RepID=UPI0033A267C9
MKTRLTRFRLLGVAACAVLMLVACGKGEIEQQTQQTQQAGKCGELKMAVNPWVGYEASAYVVGYLAQTKLGCKVTYKNLKEDVSWQGFGTNEVDVVIEDWGHPDLEKKFFAGSGDGSAVDFGPTGNVGIIGWYVPGWLAEAHPDITDWQNLNKYASEFATSESGGKGQFLGSDPSYVQFDEAIVSNLKLNFKVVFSGGEAATITAFQQAEKNRKPLIGYFWEPQYIHAELKLVKVKLPAYKDGCQGDPAKVACDYPETPLKKVVSTKWSKSDSTAVALVKKFQWTNADQNLVAKYITVDKLSAEAAAKKWVEANPDKVAAWLG